MKFEFVEFYLWNKKTKSKTIVGTVHIYVIDCELDIRGIRVFKSTRGVLFLPPYEICKDHEDVTGGQKMVRYPIVSWTNEKTQKEMIKFLNEEVKPIILKILEEKNDGI
jgi:hypothetical protein